MNLANYLSEKDHYLLKIIFENCIINQNVSELEETILDAIKNYDQNEKEQFIITLNYYFDNIMTNPIAWRANAYQTSLAAGVITKRILNLLIL